MPINFSRSAGETSPDIETDLVGEAYLLKLYLDFLHRHEERQRKNLVGQWVKIDDHKMVYCVGVQLLNHQHMKLRTNKGEFVVEIPY